METLRGSMEPTEPGPQERYDAVVKLLRNEALIEAEPSIAAFNEDATASPGGSIYYGTGLATPRELSVGLPFDVLGMILIAEKLRQKGGFDDIYHHIADTHAKTNEWADPAKIDKNASRVVSIIETLRENLELQHLHPILSSSFDSTDDYRALVESFSASEEHEYVRREMADMEWYRQRYGVRIKLGWIIQARETDMGFDERRFDREFTQFMGPVMSFVYAKPGRTFSPSRPKVSPYISTEDEGRLLLDPSVDVQRVLEDGVVKANGDTHLGGARKHLESIVRLYESLYGHLGKISLEEKLQLVIKKCFGQ